MAQSQDNADQSVDEIIASIRRIMEFDGATAAPDQPQAYSDAPTPAAEQPAASPRPIDPINPAQQMANQVSPEPAFVPMQPIHPPQPSMPPEQPVAPSEANSAHTQPTNTPPTEVKSEPPVQLERGHNTPFPGDFPLPEHQNSDESTPAHQTNSLHNAIVADDEVIDLGAPEPVTLDAAEELSAPLKLEPAFEPAEIQAAAQPLIPDQSDLEASGEEMLSARTGLTENPERKRPTPNVEETDKTAVSKSPAENTEFDTAVGAMLRPMIREWIDTNMPKIVEKIAREELAKPPKQGN